MYPGNAYRQQSTSNTRVDVILQIYEALLSKLRQARALLTSEPSRASTLVGQCRLAVVGIASGMTESSGEVRDRFLALYEFVGHSLSRGTEQGIDAAIAVIVPLYEGFLEARQEAINLERGGEIPSLDAPRLQIIA